MNLIGEPSRPSTPADQWAVALAIVFPTLVTLVYFVGMEERAPAVQQAAYAVGKGLQFAFPLAWVWFVRRGPLRGRMGASRNTAQGVLVGAAFGLGIAAAMLAVYHLWLGPAGYLAPAAEGVRRKVAGFGLNTPALYVGLAAFYALGHSFLEEYYWRWFVYAELRRFLPLSAAIAISSVGFAAHHVIVLAQFFSWSSPLTWLFSLAVAVGGAVWAWLYERCGTLGAPWASHMLIDLGIFILGYQFVFGGG